MSLFIIKPPLLLKKIINISPYLVAMARATNDAVAQDIFSLCVLGCRVC